MSTDPVNPPVSELPPPAEVAEILHFDFPSSDIVLRSCDSHNFHVSKLYIDNSSPVLREIIRSIPSTSDKTSDVAHDEEPEPLPAIELPENGEILHSLLTLIFPVVPILPSTPENIMELLAVAQKYQMASVLSHIRGAISRQHPPFFRPKTAFNLYFLARKLGLHQEAVQAAQVTLRLPMTIGDFGDKLEYPDMTGAYLYELWKYHERVRTELKSGVRDFRSSGLPEGVKGLHCPNPSAAGFGGSAFGAPVATGSLFGAPAGTGSLFGTTAATATTFGAPSSSFPSWLDNYIESIPEAPHLFDLIEFENARVRHIKEFQASYSSTCSCSDISSQLRRDFWEALTSFVDEVREKVRRVGIC